ncbi:MAG: lasso peptide biosynthesis PqqD family chaperone [Alphaproteobacteria bacterium]|nr:lasso peptide biosynthesis PqqD family chaperone [Alphaproteobacteria bacterium]
MSNDPNLNTDTVIVRSDGLIEAEVDGEVVALSIDQGTCYGLNKVGSRIWALIATPMKVGDLCNQLVAEYDVDMATCERQVLDLLEELRAEKMIEMRA